MLEQLIQPLTNLLEVFFHFTGSYVSAIVLLTVLIRLILMYPNFKSYKSQQVVTQTTQGNKEQLAALQSKLNQATTDEERKAYQLQISQIMMENFSGMKTGCLTALIQFPILTGLYLTISKNNAIMHESLLWFNLGSTDIFMAIIAGLAMMVHMYLSFKLAENSQPQMTMIMWIMPMMIVLSSLFMPSAIPFYWTVSSIWMIVQTIVFHQYKPKLAS